MSGLPASLVAPRSTSQRGVVLAAGFWFARDVLREAFAQRRILALWEAGAEVLSSMHGYVLVLHAPRPVDAALSAAAPLVREQGLLTSAPLRANERERLPADTWLVLVTGGNARALQRRELQLVDIADWLDLSAFELCRALPAPPPAGPKLRIAAAPGTHELFDARVERTDAERSEQRELLRAIQGVSDEPERPSAFRSALKRGLLTTLAGLFTLGAGLERVFASLGLSNGARARRRALPPKPSGMRRLMQRLQATFAGWVARSRLVSFLAEKQAKYLNSLLDALDAHDDLEVLKRAIPLGNSDSSTLTAPALTAPAPRTQFEIGLARASKISVMGLGESLFARLRRQYEAVFQRLDGSGKHEEAAFLLAEILNEPERAVAYLERHGRLRLAAELAEARQLPAGLVVRQWFLAGDRERAVAIAVREQAFEDAISRLERSGHADSAGSLRLLLADRLASAGRWLAAARLIHRQKEGVPLALRWLELARLAGDVSGLALELSIQPNRFGEVYAALAPLLADRGADAVPQRARLAKELLHLQAHGAKPIARELTRELFADAARLGDGALADSARKVADWIGGAFSADQPAVVTFERRLPSGATEYRYAAHDTGASRVFDVHRYGTRFAVALGEAGVALVDRAGKRVAHFDVPAEALVVSEDGSRLLALARRGDAQRVSQIDLATRRSQAWGELRLGLAARTFDGQTWLVATSPGPTPPELLLLDVLDASPSVLRRIPLPDALHSVSSLTLTNKQCEVVASNPEGAPERLCFELPSWTLRRSARLALGQAEEAHTFLHASAVVAGDPPLVCASWFELTGERRSGFWLRCGETAFELPFGQEDGSWLSLWAHDTLFAAAMTSEAGGSRLLIGQHLAQKLLLDIRLEGTRALQVRLGPERAMVCDDTGRLLVFDLTTARCLHDLRL